MIRFFFYSVVGYLVAHFAMMFFVPIVGFLAGALLSTCVAIAVGMGLDAMLGRHRWHLMAAYIRAMQVRK